MTTNPLPSMIGFMYTPFLDVPPDDPYHKVVTDWFHWAVREVRLGMAAYALRENFNLCGVIETSRHGWRSESSYEHLQDRARTGEVSAILIHGNVFMERINRIAYDQGIRVYELPPVFPIKASTPWELP